MRIEVDCDPNASAGLRRGLLSLVAPGDLVLRIGLPLAAAMPVRQFAGILAHEFGHFNQRHGMTGSYLIRRLSEFFAQVVFQRDRLDAAPSRLRHSSGFGRLFYWMAMPFIEAARGVLWLMLVLGELIACGVLRRMEYDADQVEAHVAGTRQFVHTSRVIMFLVIASQRARAELAAAWQQHRLADDLPRLIVADARQLAEHRADILKLLDDQRTHWFDTHPCHNDRVRSVERLGVAGVLDCDVPAKHLFADFHGLCRRATEALYRSLLGEEFSAAKLVPTAELVEESAEQRQGGKALRRFFRNHIVATRPVLPDEQADLPAEDARQTARALADARAAMLRAAEGLDTQRYEHASAEIAVARAKIAVCNIFPVNARTQSIYRRTQKELQQRELQRQGSDAAIDPFECAAERRLTSALRLLGTPELTQRLAGEAQPTQETARRFIAVCNALRPCVRRMAHLPVAAVRIRVLCSAHNDRQPYRPPLVDQILESTDEVVGTLRGLQSDLNDVAYPFEHATKGTSIGAALVPKLPDPQDPVDTHAAAMSVVDRFCDLTFRVLGKLCECAEKVETAVGLPALPEPPEKQDDAERLEEVQCSASHDDIGWPTAGGQRRAWSWWPG